MNVDLGESDVDVQNTRVVVRIVPVLELRGITNAQSNRSLGIVMPEEVARHSTDNQDCQDSRDLSLGQPSSTGVTGSSSRLAPGILLIPSITCRRNDWLQPAKDHPTVSWDFETGSRERMTKIVDLLDSRVRRRSRASFSEAERSPAA